MSCELSSGQIGHVIPAAYSFSIKSIIRLLKIPGLFTAETQPLADVSRAIELPLLSSADLKSGRMQLVRRCWCRFCRDCSRPLARLSSSADLIAFLQALPEGRKPRGVRYPQWLPQCQGSGALCQAPSPGIRHGSGSGAAQGAIRFHLPPSV